MDSGQHLPYTNTRLLLQEELDNEDGYYLAGTVVRLWASSTSHPAVRQTLQGLHPRRVSLGALAVQAIVNKRGPDAVVGVIPGEEKHSARLLALCQQCHDNDEVLACSMPSADMVLVPRLPSTAAQDGLYFLAYATNLRAVELCERLRQQKQVALVLDLDNTLVDAVSCTIAPNDWDLLDWRYVLVSNSYGRQIRAQYAPLPGHDHFSDDLWVMHWKVGRMNCTFKVRVRRGWSDLRQFLAENLDRFCVFVCSKGKREYIQLLWLMLDPLGQLIPDADWDARLTSTFPDTLTQAANKTALTALGCYDITKPHVPTQLALPMMCLDDSTEAYEPEYEHSIMYVQEYRPSDLLEADDGNVLRQARRRLEAFWTATCASDGTFAWQAAQSFAVALMKTMQRNPMGSPDDLSYLQVRCAKQGEALWHQFTVRGVFGEDGVFLADDPSKDDRLRPLDLHLDPASPPELPASPHTPLCATCLLPECKPGCPASEVAAAANAANNPLPLAAEPAGPEATDPMVVVPATPPADVPAGGAAAAAAAAAEEAALSEGRSSEDSMLLGLPSPRCSVLPGAAALHRLSHGGGPEEGPRLGLGLGIDMGVCGGGSVGDVSPTAEPKPKLQRLEGDEGGDFGGGGSSGSSWEGAGSAKLSPTWQQQPAAAVAPAAPAPAPLAPTSGGDPAVAAALARISRGLEAEGLTASSSSSALLRPQPKPPVSPAAVAPAWAPAPAPPAAPSPSTTAGGGGSSGGSSALAAALAAISKGLAADGLL